MDWVDTHRANDFLLLCLLSAAIADRRDADLMLEAQRHRIGHWGPLVQYRKIEADRYAYIDFGGSVLSAAAINPQAADNITYFA